MGPCRIRIWLRPFSNTGRHDGGSSGCTSGPNIRSYPLVNLYRAQRAGLEPKQPTGDPLPFRRGRGWCLPGYGKGRLLMGPSPRARVGQRHQLLRLAFRCRHCNARHRLVDSLDRLETHFRSSHGDRIHLGLLVVALVSRRTVGSTLAFETGARLYPLQSPAIHCGFDRC